MSSTPRRTVSRKPIPQPPTLDEGNIPGPPTAPGAILLVIAVLVGFLLLYIASATAPSTRDTQAPIAATKPN
jgi:hypothetical protein